MVARHAPRRPARGRGPAQRRCRFDPVDDDEPDLLLHLLFVTDDPAVVMARVEHVMRYSRAVGRYPAHGGAYEEIAFLPYRTIVPLDYDFEW